MLRKIGMVIVIFAMLCGVSQAAPYPWPNYFAHDRVVDYVEVIADYDSTNGWSYFLQVDADAVDPIYGTVLGIMALGVYPDPSTGPGDPGFDNIEPISWSVTWPEWRNGPWDNKAFGYLSERGPSTYFLPGEYGQIGTALFDGFDPADTQGYIVHIACTTVDEWGNPVVDTFWARPIPEPSSMVVLAGGLGSLLAFRRRMK